MTHTLKTWPDYYKAVKSGNKPFEVRKKDRPFKVGDKLLLQEWENNTEQYTGDEYEVLIIYILEGGAFGIQDGYVVMGLKEAERYI